MANAACTLQHTQVKTQACTLLKDDDVTERCFTIDVVEHRAVTVQYSVIATSERAAIRKARLGNTDQETEYADRRPRCIKRRVQHSTIRAHEII